MCPPSTISQPLHVPVGLPVQTSTASVSSASSILGQSSINFAVLQSEHSPPSHLTSAEHIQVECAPCSSPAVASSSTATPAHEDLHLLEVSDMEASRLHVEVALLERGRAPLHQRSEFTQQHAGVISLDSDFICKGTVHSTPGRQPAHVGLIMVDTGAQTPVIAASTVQHLVSSGAVNDSDVLTLQHKRYVQSWDKQSVGRE